MRRCRIVLVCLSGWLFFGGDAWSQVRYDFKVSAAYRSLSPDQQAKVEQVHRDLTLLWGALERYAYDHKGRVPETLRQLVPEYLTDLPNDPFATASTAAAPDTGYLQPSKNGWGYRYAIANAGAWRLQSVGLKDFPLRGRSVANPGLYLSKGFWTGPGIAISR